MHKPSNFVTFSKHFQGTIWDDKSLFVKFNGWHGSHIFRGIFFVRSSYFPVINENSQLNLILAVILLVLITFWPILVVLGVLKSQETQDGG